MVYKKDPLLKFNLALVFKPILFLVVYFLVLVFSATPVLAHTLGPTNDPFDPIVVNCGGTSDPDHHLKRDFDSAQSRYLYTCVHGTASSGSGFTGNVTSLTDPLAGNTDPTVGGIIGDLLPFIFGLAGMLTLILFMWGGIKYISARGDPKAIDDARGTLTNAVIGLIIIIFAVTIFFVVGESGFEINIFSSIPLTAPAYAQAPVNLETEFPLASIFPDVGSFFTRVVRLALAVAAGLFLAMLIWGGMRYLNSGGNQDDVDTARRVLTSAFIGLLIVVLSFAIIVLIEQAGGVGLNIF